MIKNKEKLIRQGDTIQQKKVRRRLLYCLEEVISAIDPYLLMKKQIKFKDEKLVIKNLYFDLRKFKNIYLVGAGKATLKMTSALCEILKNKITEGVINVPVKARLPRIKIFKAGHPIPNKVGKQGALAIKKILQKAGRYDLVIALISGGGSALLPLPAKGILLKDLSKINSLLIRTAADIRKINCVRKHLSQIKGGWMAKYAYPAFLVSLIISDVVGDKPDVIASGPTAPDPTTFREAIEILKKYKVWARTPKRVRKYLLLGMQKKVLETLKPKDKIFRKVKNIILSSSKFACQAAAKAAKKQGFYTKILTSELQGEVNQVAKRLLKEAKKIRKKPCLLIAGGETTMEVKGRGVGGRNQDLTLISLRQLPDNMTFISFATDGVDGVTPVPVAGAIADGATRRRGQELGLDLKKFLANNDSYHYFEKTGDLIKTGYTGTNVGDLILLAVL